jgi:hypothetical protein
MNPTVTIHSDADGVTRTITMTKTGADTGHITIASTAAPGNDQDYDVTNVRADPAALKLTCETQVVFATAEIDLSIQRGAGGQPPVAIIVVSHTVFGDGTYVYPLRAGEDQLVQNFLIQAAFPALSPPSAVVA